MSLINDALKRAREKQRNDPPPGVPPLPLVEPPARGGSGWMLGLAGILFLAAAGLFIGVAIFKHQAPPVETARILEISTPPPVPPAPARVPISTSAPASNAPPVEQLPKVQGVIFNSARPLAIVNGKAVNAGDRAGDFLVKQILKDSVVFQCPDGSQKTLAIGQ